MANNSTSNSYKNNRPSENFKSKLVQDEVNPNELKAATCPQRCFQYLGLPVPYDENDRMRHNAIFYTLHSEARLRFKYWKLPYNKESIVKSDTIQFIRRNAQLFSTATGTNSANLTIDEAYQLIQEGLVTPSKQHTKSDSQKHKCVICQAMRAKPRSFRRLPELKLHLMSHLNIMPYRCACSKRYRSLRDLQRHKKNHATHEESLSGKAQNNFEQCVKQKFHIN